MNLIDGYFVIILVLFAVNISLLLGNYKLNNFKLTAVSVLYLIVTAIVLFLSKYLNYSLLDYFSYLFLVFALIIFAVTLFYLRSDNFNLTLSLTTLTFISSMLLVSSQNDIDFFSLIIYSISVFIISVIVYQITKLLHHAKRQYNVIVGEFMSLFSILLFVFSLTYNSTRNLDYTMFSSFLILTPTYQLIYVIIIISVILIAGVVINESNGGNS